MALLILGGCASQPETATSQPEPATNPEPVVAASVPAPYLLTFATHEDFLRALRAARAGEDISNYIVNGSDKMNKNAS